MTLSVVFRRAAQAEFDAAALRYDVQRQGLGAQFVAEVGRVIELVTTYPDRFPLKHREIRQGTGAALSVLSFLPGRI